jgi:lipoate-protein ligase A
MARDHAPARHVAVGEGVLRLYEWESATVSFGRNEPSRSRYDLDAAADEAIDFVRRPTGGRAVLHDEEVTYAVAVRAGALGGVRDAYRLLNEGLVCGLERLGVRATLAGAGPALPPDAGPCFRAPAEGEVMVGRRKLVGSAQARVEGALLQHGSVILRGNQDRLARLSGVAGDAAPPSTVEEAVGAVSSPDVARSLADGLQQVLGGRWRESQLSAAESETALALIDERYGSSEWTWRR